jgi:hypothetical protein
MNRHPVRLAVVATLVAAGLSWNFNSNPWSGPTVLRLTRSHGVHANDWVMMSLWSAAVVIAWPLSVASWRRTQRVLVNRSA